MTINWIEMIDACSASALASGALQPVQVEQTEIEEGGLQLQRALVSSLAVKDAHPVLAMKHCFVRVHCGKNVTVEVAADSLCMQGLSAPATNSASSRGPVACCHRAICWLTRAGC